MSTVDRSVPADDAVALWGLEAEMSSFEAVMWRAEAEPRLRSDGVVVELLDGTPDWDRLGAAHRRGARLVPRLAQRVVEDPLLLGPPSWVDTELDLEHHLTRVRLDDGAGLGQVLELAAELMMAPFDRTRPLWRSILVEGLPDGTSAYLLKAHHSLSDGTGAIQLFDLMHSGQREPAAHAEPATAQAKRRTRRATDLVAGSLGAALRLTADLLAHPKSPGEVVAYTRSLARVLQPETAGSPLLQPRGLSRRLGVLEVSVDGLRKAGKAAGGSLNDAYLAALLGGLRRYHLLHGTELSELPMAFPVTIRGTDDAPGGNRFAAASMAGPLGDVAPADRIREVSRRSRMARSEPALDFLSRLAPVMARLPAAVLGSLAMRTAERIDLQASNIPGLTRESYLAGCRVERMFVFGPTPGCAIMATLVSHQATCCIGITVDHEAVPDPDTLLRCVEAGLAEVLSVAGS
jgi:diacylglycerol O-acyltransferase